MSAPSLYYHCASFVGLGHLAPAAQLAVMLAVLAVILLAARVTATRRASR
jgi:hypothetical protein